MSKDIKRESIKIEISNKKLVTLKLNNSFSIYLQYEKLKSDSICKIELLRAILSESDDIVVFDDKIPVYLNDFDLNIIVKELLLSNNQEIIDEKYVIDQYIDLIETEIKEISIRITPALRILVERMNEINKPVIKMLSSINDSSSSLIFYLNKLAESFRSNQFYENITTFLLEFNKIISSIDEATLIALKYDWFLSHDTIQNDELFSEVLKLGRNGATQSEFDKMFLTHFDEQSVLKIIDNISKSPDCEKFRNALKEIHIGYSKKLYYLVVPAILCIFEGLIATSMNHRGRMKQEIYKSYLSKIFDRKRFNGVRDLVLYRVLTQFDYGDEIVSPLSRHAIFHGADNNYGTRANTLRSILILNEIVYALENQN